MMLLMGTVYTWSILRVEVENVYNTNTLQSGLPYMTSLFFYALSMMITGRLLKQKNTQKIAIIGVLLISLGWLLASQSGTLISLTLSYGVLIGIGVGMVYGIPIFIINQRFKKSGFYAGIVLSGFGASPLLTAPIVHLWIQNVGLQQTFLNMSMISIIILLPLTFLLKYSQDSISTHPSLTVKPFSLKTFVLLYTMFLLATTIGLTMIGLSYRIGVVNYGFNTNAVAMSVSAFALMNGLSRPLFGKIVDAKGFLYAAGLSIILVNLATLIAVMNQGDNLLLYGISMGLYWFNLGAWLAMLPASIKHYFGTHSYAKNYGLMFTSYGFGAILGTLFSGTVLDLFFSTRYLYFAVFINFSFLVIISLFLKKHTIGNQT